MTDSSAHPKNLFVCVYLYGSDPVSVRYVMLPGQFSADDIAKTAAVLFGLDGSGLSFSVALPEAGEMSEKRTAADLFGTAGRMTVTVCRSEERKTGESLRFNLEVTECPQRALSSIAEDLAVPKVYAAFGFDIPDSVWDISQINRIGARLAGSEFCKYGTDRFFRREDMIFSPRKCENALRKLFAPETARNELDRRQCVPMIQLLERRKVYELHEIIRLNRMYSDSTIRKSELIGMIIRHTDPERVAAIMNELSLREYSRFRALMLGEKAEEEISDPEEIFPIMFRYGLCGTLPARGFCLAAEAVDWFERLYNEGQEEKHLEEKHMEAALRACGALYTAFSRDMFLRVYSVISPGSEPKAASDWLFLNGTGVHAFCRLAYLDRGIWYRTDHLMTKDIMKLWKQNKHTPDSVYLPGRDEALELAERDSCSVYSLACGKLYALLSEYPSYSVQSVPRTYYEIVSMIRSDRPEQEIIEKTVSCLHYMIRRKSLSEISALIRNVCRETPRVSLGGYTEENCPPAVLKYAKEIRERREGSQIMLDIFNSGRAGQKK